MFNRTENIVGRRRGRASKGSVAVVLSSLLMVSLSFMSIGAPTASGDGQDQINDEVAAEPTTWIETPTETPTESPIDNTADEFAGEEVLVESDESSTESSVESQAESAPSTEELDSKQAASESDPAAATMSATRPDVLDTEEPQLANDVIMPMAVPPAAGNDAVVSVKVGGTRTDPTVVSELAGVELGLYASKGSTTPVAGLETCVTDADGDCSFTVPNAQTTSSWWGTVCSGANCDKQFWVGQIVVPGTHYANPSLGTGTTGTIDSYRFQTPQLRAKNTYRSTANFMYNNTGDQNSSGIWQNSLKNPTFPQQCGINVALVLDLSASVKPAEFTALKAAANGFVDSLTGTPSKVGTFTFASRGPASEGDTLLPVSVSSTAGATIVKKKISDYTQPGGNFGGTNWDRGLYQVARAASNFDVAVVITDGNPTFYGQGVDAGGNNWEGPGNRTRFREVENGIFSANAIKAQGTRVIAFGVGSGVVSEASGLNLRAISGEIRYPEANADYYQSSDYMAAGAELRKLALGSCEGSISVVKQVIPAGGTLNDATPAGGWTFTAQGSTGVTVTAPIVRNTSSDTGAANFPLTFANANTAGPVTLTETPQSGYKLEQAGGKNAICKRLDTGGVITPANVTNGFTVDANPKYPISCTVYNRTLAPAVLTLVKDVKNSTTGASYVPANWTLSAVGPTPISGAGNSAKVTNQTVGVGTYTLSESGGPDGYTASKWSCTAGSLTGSQLTLNFGDKATCTITNTAQPSKLTLLKTITNNDGGDAKPVDWTLTASGPTTGVSGKTGSAAVSGKTIKVGKYTLSEAGGPSGYTPGAWSCDGGILSGSKLTIGVGEEVTCTINNDDQPALLTLVKTVTNDDRGTAIPTDWTLTAEGSATSDESPITITGPVGSETVTKAPVPAGSYKLSESDGPDGYSAGDWNCEGGSLTGSEVTVTVGKDVTCTINNDDQPYLFIEKWGNVAGGDKGLVGGSAFEVRLVEDDNPADEAKPVMPVDGDTGRFDVGPLAPGDYLLVETRAPSGHTLLAEPVGFTIAADGALTIADNNPQATITSADPHTLTIRITDVAAIPLPLSGGGAVNFAVLAMVVLGIGGFGAVLIRRQRPQTFPIPG